MHVEASRAEAVERLTAALAELQQVEREAVEQDLVPRVEAPLRIKDAVRRLAGLGSPAAVISRSAYELGQSSDFDRVLISRASPKGLSSLAHWCREPTDPAREAIAALDGVLMPVRYPQVEAEVIQRQRGELVGGTAAEERSLPELSGALGWSAYAVAPIRLEGEVAGLLHVDRLRSRPEPDALDLECAVIFADGLGRAYERAVLREKLHRQRQQLQLAGRWINGQSLGLSEESAGPQSDSGEARHEVSEVLTPRELEVIEQVARGRSNREIAAQLVIGEGTVKYHVKNVLRKLGARSRAEAVSAYLRMRGTG